jgi:hypothetical protein
MLKDYRPLPWADRDEAWRPTSMTPELAAQLAADSAMENAGGDADDRLTCFTHQCWWGDCIVAPSHANPLTKFNWCDKDWSPVQICGCRPASVEG